MPFFGVSGSEKVLRNVKICVVQCTTSYLKKVKDPWTFGYGRRPNRNSDKAIRCVHESLNGNSGHTIYT